MQASKPPLVMKTSGNSSGQWNGVRSSQTTLGHLADGAPGLDQPRLGERCAAASVRPSARVSGASWSTIVRMLRATSADASGSASSSCASAAPTTRSPSSRASSSAGVGLREHRRLALGVEHVVDDERFKLPAERERPVDGGLNLIETEVEAGLPAPVLVEVRNPQLLEVRDVQQRVAGAQGVIHEGERSALGERDQPHRELGHLDGQWVLVNAVQACARRSGGARARRARSGRPAAWRRPGCSMPCGGAVCRIGSVSRLRPACLRASGTRAPRNAPEPIAKSPIFSSNSSTGVLELPLLSRSVAGPGS